VAAVTALVADFKEGAPTLLLTLKTGSVQGKELAQSTLVASQSNLQIDLLSGAWGVTNGSSGVLSGGDLKALLQAMDAVRNATEALFVTTSTVSGQQVPWDTASAVAVADAQPVKG